MRILNTADIHLHDYSRYNLDQPEFRLNQFITLAHRLAVIYKEQNCEKIIISGDSIQTAVIPPQTQHILKEFYRILSEAVQENGGEVIEQLGNHDRDSRAKDSKAEESIVTLMELIPNIRYVHKEVLEFDGLTVGFQDFLPEHGLEWYDGKIDILFNHYTDMGLTWGGQEIDKSRFGLMFFGDIHVPYIKGNIVSIGNPIPHRLKDSCEGLALIIDTQDSQMGYVPDPDEIIPINYLDKTNHFKVNENRSISFKWVEVINEENPFLRLYRPDKPPRKSAGEWKYDIEVPYSIVQKRVYDESEIEIDMDSLDIDKILESTLNDTTRSVHTQVLELSKGTEISEESVSMDFKMISSEIKNYRSIEDFKMVWKNDVVRMSGKIGSGKSTVASAMMFNFFGNRLIRDQFRDTADIKKDSLSVDQVLEYKGTFFRINRGYDGKGFLKYWKSTDEDKVLLDSYLDDKDPNFFQNQQANKVTDIDAMIRRDLPFLDMYNLIYISQQSNGLFTDMKKNERIEMISKMLGWNKIVDFSEIAVNMHKVKKEEIAVIKVEIDKISGAIELVESMGLKYDDTDYQKQLDELTSNRLLLLKEIEKQKIYEIEINKYNLDSKEAQLKLSTAKPLMDGGLDVSIDQCNAFIDGVKNDISEINKKAQVDKEQYNLNVQGFLDDKAKIQFKKDEYNKKISDGNLSNMQLEMDVKTKTTDFENIQFKVEEYKNNLNIAERELNKEIKDTCITCGQDVHDEAKILEAKNKRQENYDKIKINLDAEILDLAVSKAALKMAKDDLDNKVDCDSFKEIIVKLDTMYSNLDTEHNKIEPVNYRLDEIQVLSDSSFAYKIHINSLTTHNNTINEGLVLEEKSKEQKITAEQMIHYDDEKIAQFHQKIESILSTHSEMVGYKSKAEQDNKTIKDTEDRTIQREDLSGNILDIQSVMLEITEYIDLTSFGGQIVQKILEKTSDILSTDTMKVKTISEQKNGNHKPDLTLSVLIGEKWKDYSQLSGGQLFYADIKFILSLFDLIGGCGLFVVDEAMKFFDADMIDEIGSDIKCAKILDTMIIIHEQAYIHIDREVHAKLDDQGITIHS